MLPGFGLRITANGAKSWVAMYRVNGKTVMETLGPLAKIPRVADARVLARESMATAATGEHPVEARERQSASIFGPVAELFLERYARKHMKPSSWKEVERQLRVDVLPKWGKRPIASISRKDVIKLLQGIEDRGAPVQANRTRAHLHTLLNWAMRADLVAENPVSKVDKAVPERARDRVLADTEIVFFWEAAGKLGWPFGPLFKLLLVTAQRRDEVCGITWDELDLERRVWTIPRERAKNDRAHEVYLSDLALEIIAEVPRQNAAMLFTTNRERQVSGFSKAKRALDRHMLNLLQADLASAGKDPAQAAISDFVLHDLRRTAATAMARLNVPPHVVDRLLNHVSGQIRGVAAVYNRHAYIDERKIAIDGWARHLESLLRPVPANVVAINSR